MSTWGGGQEGPVEGRESTGANGHVRKMDGKSMG